MKQKGFTLIELLIAISLMAIVGIISIAGFSSYNQSQVIQTSAESVATMLNLARSRAQSQIKPVGCVGTLQGYRVRVTTPRSYSLYVICFDSGSTPISQQGKVLPSNLEFSFGISIFFPVIEGGSIAACVKITQTAGSLIRYVKVNSMGEASVRTTCP